MQPYIIGIAGGSGSGKSDVYKRQGIVQARATMDIGAYGKDFAVDVFE